MADGEVDAAVRATTAAFLTSPLVSVRTREVLRARLAAAPKAGDLRYFTNDERDDLLAIVERLLPPASAVTAIDVVAAIDSRVPDARGRGWRYATMPTDGEGHRTALADVRRHVQDRFAAMSVAKQDALLADVANGRAPWMRIDAARWFEQLLVDVSETHVAHPATQAAMRCTAFMDLPATAAERVVSAERARAVETPPVSLRHWPEGDEVDAVVIGTGAGGGPLMWRLARAGLAVVALEAGRRWKPSEEFATDEQAQTDLFWRDERLSAGADPLAFGSNNSGIGVGGSTLHFTAYTPRPQPDDFRLARDFGVGRDWPIGYDDLEPYFDELERIVGVSGPADYPWGPRRASGYPLRPLPLNVPALLMERGCASIGVRTACAPNAALSRPYASLGRPLRNACTQRGFCQAGCTTGAKGSVDVVFVDAALEAGAELRTEAFATRIERDAAGAVTGVVYTQHGVERRQRCAHVFLCAGAIESPRLLLANDSLSNGSGQVGRHFMAHTGLQLWGFFDEPTTPWRGIPGGLISEDFHRPADADFAGGYLLQSIGVMPVTYASQLARSGQNLYGGALADHLARYDHVAGINILGECLPAQSNFVELSDEHDARGLPKPRVHFTAGDNEQRLTRHAERTMRAIWSAAGASDPWSFQRFAHIIGTCRMGSNADDAVVDADGRSFEVPGLSICDNSVFPSALSANPALTIMALALRTADRFIARNERN